MPAACLPCVLFAAFAGRLACVRIDQMQPPARKAGDALIAIAGALGLVLVRSPTLHAEACVRAAVDEWRRSVILSGAKLAFLAQCQRRRPLQLRDADPLASAGVPPGAAACCTGRIGRLLGNPSCTSRARSTLRSSRLRDHRRRGLFGEHILGVGQRDVALRDLQIIAADFG